MWHRHALRALAWAAVVGVVPLWWAPTLGLALVGLLLGRLRFEVVIGFGHALVAIGCPEAARRVYAGEIVRAEQEMRALVGRVR